MINNIGLYGVRGLYNLGCEAIIRGAYEFFNDARPNCRITYYSYNFVEDKRKLADLDIEIKPIKLKTNIFKRIVNKALKLLKIDFQIISCDYKDMLNNVDLLVSVGGDLYTIPAYMRRKNTYPYQNDIVEIGKRFIRKGKKVIIYGASIGPFGDYSRAKEYYFNHLKKVDLIVAREEKCVEYLKANGVNENVCLLPDPAFFVKTKSDAVCKKEYIGINLSPLSIKELYGELTEEVYASLASIIMKIYSNTACDLLLLPHVVSPFSDDDNDLIFQQKIYSRLDSITKEHVRISSKDSFINMKQDLDSCRMIVSARMHCAINAVCESIPTVFLSYSSKAEGMAEYIYGNGKWVISIKEMKEKLLPKVKEMLDSEEELSKFLIKRNQEIIKDEKNATTLGRIEKILNYGK